MHDRQQRDGGQPEPEPGRQLHGAGDGDDDRHADERATPGRDHQVSMLGRFLPARGSGAGAASSRAVIQRRVSAGSMTSSISK